MATTCRHVGDSNSRENMETLVYCEICKNCLLHLFDSSTLLMSSETRAISPKTPVLASKVQLGMKNEEGKDEAGSEDTTMSIIDCSLLLDEEDEGPFDLFRVVKIEVLEKVIEGLEKNKELDRNR
ncbi:unnamed protein product [Agarophyton chilense]